MNTIEFIDKKINYLKIKNPKVWFENGVIVSKVVFLILLIILGFINADISFVSKNPRDFLTETFLTALLAALPTILMAYNRGAKTEDIISATFITFFFFFLFNTLMEFAGLNGYLNGYDSDNEVQKGRIEQIESQWWIWLIIVLVGLVMIYLAIITHDFPKRMLWTILLTELAVFSILNTIPQSIIAYNRGTNVAFATFLSLLFYIVVYVILQSGGFFTHIFGSIDHLANENIYKIGKENPEDGELIASPNSDSSRVISSSDDRNNNRRRYEESPTNEGLVEKKTEESGDPEGGSRRYNYKME
jgi:uncharacterized membrane protein YhaH (DUF805 family)